MKKKVDEMKNKIDRINRQDNIQNILSIEEQKQIEILEDQENINLYDHTV